jgi:hypothetical protein
VGGTGHIADLAPRVPLDLGCVWMGIVSAREVTLTLTAEQVAQVVDYVVVSDGEHPWVFASLEGIQALPASPLREGPELSAALLRGLVVLISFPPDGAERSSKQVAQESGMAESTVHRYIRTWVAVGLLEQNQVTRQYRRVRPMDYGKRGSGKQ